ncbi:MAG: peptide chain release factor-like protein [Pirellula sp.]|nr:peptide chain release factor-like protein [Pirellula sp.]
MHPACLPIHELEADCRFRFSRGSGPGGQHRNKVETLVTIEHIPTGLIAHAGEARNQNENRRAAMQRLRCVLAIGVRAPVELSRFQPSSVWMEYCRSQRLRISEGNEDFPALLAEAMDILAANDWDPALSAKCLNVSATQLVRLLSQYPPALGALNQELIARGRATRNRS